MDTPSAPAAPDPAATAAAQTASNKATAISQYGLNATNQVTPNGTLTYSQNGTWPDGTPRFTATTALSPQQQQLYDLSNKTQTNLGQIGVDESSKIGALLNTPFNVDSATTDKLVGMQREMLDPQWNQKEESLRTQLINSGVRPGTDAYTRAMQDFSTQKQTAYDQMYSGAYGQGQQAALTQRNQPINEISALLSGSQVQQPNFQTTPTAGVAPTDVIGATGQSLAQQNVGYNADVANQRAMMSGLFGLGSTALGGWAMSDREVKKDIKKIGELDSGLPIYSFRYKKGGGLIQLGLMAQDVEKVLPEAVAETGSGYKAVNYSAVAEAHG